MRLKNFGNTPFGVSMLDAVFPANRALIAKANRLEASGDIIRLKRGLYVNSPHVSGKRINEFLLANHIYGPSYVSMQSALRFYGLIPERVCEVTSMTTRLTKSFSNVLGTFTYLHCGEEYYSKSIVMREEDGVGYLMATPEKALCDLMIYTTGLNMRFKKELRIYLEEDLRMDMDELCRFDVNVLREIRSCSKKKNMLTQLIKLIEYERNV